MSRKKPVMTRRIRRHDEHTNHEAWAIPYGDLVTLLLAFFVVMYAISSVNAGKYRVLSDSLFAAFRGAPRTMDPVQVGEKPNGSGAEIEASIVQSTLQGQQRSSLAPVPVQGGNQQTGASPIANHLGAHALAPGAAGTGAAAAAAAALEHLADEVARAMDDLVKQNLVVVRRSEFWIEVEIKTDILYPSGSAHLAPYAVDVIQRLGSALAPFPNPIRVEGHTDNKPISTVAFYSNWELSAARAGSVVRVLQAQGVGPERLAVIGYGDTRPAQPNDSEQGRNANRRVVVVILSTELQRQKAPDDQPTNALGPIPPSTGTPTPSSSVTVQQPGTAPATGNAAASTPATATPTSSSAESGTPATAFPAPAAQATLAAPAEPAQLPGRQAPSAASNPSTAAATSANVTLSTSGAHVAGSGIVPAP
jgi:chemotaxis protein MotB